MQSAQMVAINGFELLLGDQGANLLPIRRHGGPGTVLSLKSSMMAKKSVRRSGGKPERKLARDKIFEVAADLFYRQGVRAVGVEAIAKQAGVAKVSLYRSFPSKDDLVVAYLENRNAVFWHHWDAALASLKGNPRAQLRAIMTSLAHRAAQPGYRGCPFINYCVEFPEPPFPGRKVAEANKCEIRRRFVQIAEALGARQPKQLADSLLLLVEGAYAASQTIGGPKGLGGNALIWAAEALIAAQPGVTRGRT
jgi:AcrR family transcriptional regulator